MTVRSDSELRELAQNATPGPWIKRPLANPPAWQIEGENAKVVAEVVAANMTDASFIAACDPQTVLALLNRAQAAEAEVGRLTQERDEAVRAGLALIMATGEAILVTTPDEVRIPRQDWDKITEKAIAARRTIDPLAVPDDGLTPMERLGAAERLCDQLRDALERIASLPRRTFTIHVDESLVGPTQITVDGEAPALARAALRAAAVNEEDDNA